MSELPTSEQPPAVAITDGIRVEARSHLVPANAARSFLAADPEGAVALFTYRIRLTNLGTAPARLLRRHWIIVDADGRRRDVEGVGVIGQEPHLQPGESFVYDSYCPLATPWGTMEGEYLFQRDDGSRFEVRIPRFLLRPPRPTTARANA